jgi:hypothetical protein
MMTKPWRVLLVELLLLRDSFPFHNFYHACEHFW